MLELLSIRLVRAQRVQRRGTTLLRSPRLQSCRCTKRQSKLGVTFTKVISHCYNSEESHCYHCYNSEFHCYNSEFICQIVWEPHSAGRVETVDARDTQKIIGFKGGFEPRAPLLPRGLGSPNDRQESLQTCETTIIIV